MTKPDPTAQRTERAHIRLTEKQRKQIEAYLKPRPHATITSIIINGLRKLGVLK